MGRDTAPQKKTFESVMEGRILSGALRPGDRLPSERELAVSLGMSRSTVNQGVLELERRGFLRVVPRQGTFVADYRREATPQTFAVIMNYGSDNMDKALVRDLMEMRILIERECARLACRRPDAAAAARLVELVEATYTDDADALADAIYEFHRFIVQLSGNSVYMMIFHSFKSVLDSLTRAHFKTRAEFDASVPLFWELAEAVSAGDPDRAADAMEHMLSGAEKYLLTSL